MAPATWLVEHADWLPASGHALDVACGQGRHALWLAKRGLTVLAIDRHAEALATVRDAAAAAGLPVITERRDLESGADGRSGAATFGVDVFDVIVVVHYLHRPLVPALIAALRPGGVLVYETFTRAQARLGKPTNPDFLLEREELRGLVEPLEILDYREGLFDGREIASVVARRRASPPPR